MKNLSVVCKGKIRPMAYMNRGWQDLKLCENGNPKIGFQNMKKWPFHTPPLIKGGVFFRFGSPPNLPTTHMATSKIDQLLCTLQAKSETRQTIPLSNSNFLSSGSQVDPISSKASRNFGFFSRIFQHNFLQFRIQIWTGSYKHPKFTVQTNLKNIYYIISHE